MAEKHRTVVPRITLEVVRQAFADPASGNPYYVREDGGRDSIRGCCLRVQRRSVQFGTRTDRGTYWHRVVEARPDMSLEEVEEARLAVRRLIRQVEDEEELPELRRGRTMTLRELSESYLKDYQETRAARRSERTIDAYRSLWKTHLLPLAGDLRLREITSGVVQGLKTEIAARARTQGGRAKGDGIYAANRSLQQLDAALRFALAREWILRNPATRGVVARFEEARAEEFLDDAAYAAIGKAIRKLEACASRSRIRYLAALRLAIYTGARHREEILWPELSWCRDLDGTVPRIGISRAKGDRGARQGRWIYLGPHGARLIREMDRPVGSEHLVVPGQRIGSPLHTLIPLWREVLESAGLPRMTVKALRHSHRTHAVIAGLPEEHERQLLGHRGAAVTDTVYLHRHGPALASAAAKIEGHLRQLMGDEFAVQTAPAQVNQAKG